MSRVLKATSPSGTYSCVLEPLSLEFGGDLNEPLSMTFTLPRGYGDFSDDTSLTNPLQLLSGITYTRNSIKDFDGVVISITLTQDGSQAFPQQLRVECVDKLHWIKTCVAGISGNTLAKVKTSVELREDQTMLPLVANSTIYYPDPDDTDLYLQLTGTPAVVLTSTAGISAVATTITTNQSTSGRMRTKGLLSIGARAEYVAYDGYDDNGSGAWQFSGVTRGVLGSSAALHGAAGLYQLAPKRIDPDTLPEVEGDPGGGAWEVISADDYTVNYDDGSIIFDADPSVAYPGGIRATYYTFDEDDADAYLLGGDSTYGIIDLLLAQTKANGGPALASGAISIDIPRVVIPITQLTGANLLDTIAQMLDEQVDAGVSYDASQLTVWPVAYWWDSPNGDFVIDKFSPTEAATARILHAEKIERSNVIANAHSGVLAKYTIGGTAYAALVNVTNALGSSGTVYKSEVYTKFLGTGCPNIKVIDCGQCSEVTARSMAAAELRKSWTLAYGHEYRLKNVPDTLPVRGKRYTMPGGITGRCTRVQYNMTNGFETFSMTIVDLDQVLGV